MAVIRRWFPLAPAASGPSRRIPGRSTRRRPTSWPRRGVNRVSLGAQSFQPELLRPWSGTTPRTRWRGPSNWSGPRFARWSLDLIFGVPGSTLDGLGCRPGDRAWRSGPRTCRATAWSTRRGRASGSSGGPGRSRRWTRRSSGDVRDRSSTGSKARGWRCTRSPIRPARRTSRGTTWSTGRTTPTSASGLGAARYVGGVRSVNTRDLPAYLRRIEAGEPATGPTETLGPRGASTRDGRADAPPDGPGHRPRRFPAPDRVRPRRLVGPAIAKYVGEGLLEDDGRRVRFTREGLFLADRVLCEPGLIGRRRRPHVSFAQAGRRARRA